MAQHPSGTVTFLFTDIEGSTQRWQHDDQAMSAALASHDHLIRLVVERHGGVVFKHTGDGVCAVFTSAPGPPRRFASSSTATSRRGATTTIACGERSVSRRKKSGRPTCSPSTNFWKWCARNPA